MNQHLQRVPECGRDSPADVLPAEKKIRYRERQACNVYLGIGQTLNASGSVATPGNYLATRLIPAFSKIGVDEVFVRLLLGLAPKAWEALDSSPGKVVHLHPNMQQEIAEVRQGLLIQADRKMALRSEPAFMTPQESFDRLQETMDPANLHLLIDEITTPWIVLPRAYISLRLDHVHYLPAYLEMIDNETNEEVLHIFTRIAIEFLANFTVRFADEKYSREQVVRLVSAGYEALFWRNLKVPPRGFEDIRLFEHFLTWLKHSGYRAQTVNHDLEATIQEMEATKEVIFPPESDLIHRIQKCPDISRFIVALRHGCKGIDCTSRYFWLIPGGNRWPRGQGTQWGIVIFSLKSLFDLITRRYAKESQRTQYYIREFLFQINNTYACSVIYDTTLDQRNRSDLQRLRSKIMTMVQQLQQILSQKMSKYPDPEDPVLESPQKSSSTIPIDT
jgi:hypothetical protein